MHILDSQDGVEVAIKDQMSLLPANPIVPPQVEELPRLLKKMVTTKLTF